MAAPDPLTSQDTRTALARRSQFTSTPSPRGLAKFASDAGGAIANQFTQPDSYINRAGAVLGDLVTLNGNQYADIPASASGDYTHNAVFGDGNPAAATPASTPAAAPVATPSPVASADAQRQNLGMTRLAPGVARSSVPGVYVARGKDGSAMFSNVMGANGQPDFGTLTPQEQAAAAGMSRRFAGTQVSAGAEYYNPDTGMTSGPGVGAFTRDTQAGQVDPNGLNGVPAAAGGANANYTYAKNSMGADIGGVVDATTNPFQAQANLAEFENEAKSDPNGSNPEIALANQAAKRRLTGAYYDRLREFQGNPGAQSAAMMGGYGGLPLAGAMGVGTGTGTGRGGSYAANIKDFADAEATRQNAATNAASAQAAAIAKQRELDEAQEKDRIATLQKDPVAQGTIKAAGIAPDDYAFLRQFNERGGDMTSQNADAVRARRILGGVVQRGLANARGIGDKIGNWIGVDDRPQADVAIDPKQQLPYKFAKNYIGQPMLTDSAGQNYVNLAGQYTGAPYGDSDAGVRALYNDPTISPLLLQALGMARKQQPVQ